jgi:serine/threonine-protein kinase
MSPKEAYAKARGAADRALKIDPQLALAHRVFASQELVGWALFSADRLPEAEAAFRSLLERNPSYAGAHCELSEVLLAERKTDAALAISRDESDEAARTFCMADALWVLGQRPEATALLTEGQAKYGSARAYNIAESYALRDQKDEAFKWLDRAYENREAQITMFRSDPSLRGLRADPRFTALGQKMHLL